MSPHLVCRMANEIPNFVGIKNIAPPDHTRMIRILCGDKIIVTDAEEENWLMNLVAKRQPAYISSALAFLLQTKKRPHINEMTALAEKGEYAKAIEIYMKIEPIRNALVRVTPPGKRQATHKYWAQCLGLAGGDGRVRPPYQQLTQAEKDAIKAAVQESGLI
jgi:dihydrodipicolinate synthase/N-acetylneuraminate lyase